MTGKDIMRVGEGWTGDGGMAGEGWHEGGEWLAKGGTTVRVIGDMRVELS